jgi:F-type H+-transporting ATPase subunit b
MSISIEGLVLAQVTGTEPETAPDDVGEMIAEEVGTAVGVDHHDAGMPQLEFGDYAPQLVWLAITFVALYFLMSRVALPRIATVIESRRDRVANDLDTAARLRSETDEVIAAYEQELAEARNKAHRIAAETRDRLNAELGEERARIESELAERTDESERQIAAARDKALAGVDSVAREAAADIVETLLGAKPTAKELDGAVKAAKGS